MFSCLGELEYEKRKEEELGGAVIIEGESEADDKAGKKD